MGQPAYGMRKAEVREAGMGNAESRITEISTEHH
jgi:hypothetical protein